MRRAQCHVGHAHTRVYNLRLIVFVDDNRVRRIPRQKLRPWRGAGIEPKLRVLRWLNFRRLERRGSSSMCYGTRQNFVKVGGPDALTRRIRGELERD